MKLNKRLKQIEHMVTNDYTHIWDCCCDHGFLGAALLSRQAAEHVHFVDIVPELMAELDDKLQRFYANSLSTWQTHCLDVAKLPLAQYQGKHLVIIAGVGGDLMKGFISSICQKHPQLELDFLLCPVHHQFALRQHLISLDFSLQREILVEENKRFYEVLLVSSNKNQGNSNSNKISAVGEDIWHATTPQQTEVVSAYLNKTLTHYQRIQQGQNHEVEHILKAYQAVQPSFN